MRPQLQKYINGTDGQSGDCHRTCIAMILNMDRDEVPHFMVNVPPRCPPDDPRSKESVQLELEWLAQHGLTVVNVPFPGDTDIAHLLESLSVLANDAPVVLGCSAPNGNHSVVVWRGEIYNPTNGVIVGPQELTGFWWLTIYSVGPNWMNRQATRELSFRAGWEAAADAALRGDNPAAGTGLRDALAKHLQPEPAPPTVVAEQEVPSNDS